MCPDCPSVAKNQDAVVNEEEVDSSPDPNTRASPPNATGSPVDLSVLSKDALRSRETVLTWLEQNSTTSPTSSAYPLPTRAKGYTYRAKKGAAIKKRIVKTQVMTPSSTSTATTMRGEEAVGALAADDHGSLRGGEGAAAYYHPESHVRGEPLPLKGERGGEGEGGGEGEAKRPWGRYVWSEEDAAD